MGRRSAEGTEHAPDVTTGPPPQHAEKCRSALLRSVAWPDYRACVMHVPNRHFEGDPRHEFTRDIGTVPRAYRLTDARRDVMPGCPCARRFGGV